MNGFCMSVFEFQLLAFFDFILSLTRRAVAPMKSYLRESPCFVRGPPGAADSGSENATLSCSLSPSLSQRLPSHRDMGGIRSQEVCQDLRKSLGVLALENTKTIPNLAQSAAEVVKLLDKLDARWYIIDKQQQQNGWHAILRLSNMLRPRREVPVWRSNGIANEGCAKAKKELSAVLVSKMLERWTAEMH
jgi:hypothetical protein